MRLRFTRIRDLAQIRMTAIFLGCFLLFGCVSLPTIGEIRELPGFSNPHLSKEGVSYDPSVRAYRLREKTWYSVRETVLRDAAGKKIQTEDELVRIIEAPKWPTVPTGTKLAAYTLSTVYTPIVLIEDAINATLRLPFSLLEPSIEVQVDLFAEGKYSDGRRHFELSEFESALFDWETAKEVRSVLAFNSDVDYWRGRAFEALGKTELARAAYVSFLNYSEQSTPSFFNEKFPGDSSWPQKADDAEKRLWSLYSSKETLQE